MSDTTIDSETIETIDIYLIGNKEEIAEGMKLIDFHFRERIVSFISKRAPSANIDDSFDIYQDVLIGISKDAQDGKYDPDSTSLKAYIYQIASNKTISWLRRKLALKRNPDTDQETLIDSVAEAIRDSSIYEAWQYAHLNESRSTILRTIRNLIPKLKLRQRQVAEIMKESFPYILSDNEIKIKILNSYGEDITRVAVKSARENVYKKIRETVTITGYGDPIDV